MITINGHNLIGFQESNLSNNTFYASNPVTGDKLEPVFYEATESEVDRAVKMAEKSFDTYRSKSKDQRADFLEAIADEILALGDQLIDICCSETALPVGRITGERGRTMNQLKLFAKVVREGSWIGARIDEGDSSRTPAPKPDLRQMQTPLGPVGIFGASNFPLAFSVAGGDTASALAAGCPVVVKGHPLHPNTSELVGKAINKAAQKTDMPEGVFSLVHGISHHTGMAIVRHPLIKAVGFTGSYKGGQAIFDAANQRPEPIPVFAEMGSTNPVFILPQALEKDKAKLAASLVNSINMGVGQFCTNPGLVITQGSSDAHDFLATVKEEVGNNSPGTMLSEGIKSNYVKGIYKINQHHGTHLIAKSQPTDTLASVPTHVFSVDGGTFLNSHVLEEEVFGPSTVNVIADSRSQMIEVAQSLEGHLTATIHGTDEELALYQDLIQILERKVGRLIFNGFPTGVEVGYAMTHGGPYPSTTASQSTSVGTGAINRFTRPISYQDFPQAALPAALRNENPLGIWRMKDGNWSKF